jgi:beta-glucoside operon transcriptional antiterminator
MTVIRKYNNNVILANEDGQEVIALGCGLGFNAAAGSPVDARFVEKVFVPQETVQMQRFKDILSDLPYEHIILASKIIDQGKARLDQPLNQSIIIALADHLSFAIKRLHDHLNIQMPLAWDVQHIYPAEFAVGLEALEIIKQQTGIAFPSAEAAVIALHFINAESEAADMPGTIKMAQAVKKAVGIIEGYFGTIFDENTFDFVGLVTLLRNTIMRFIYPSKAEKQVTTDTELYELLRKRYRQEFMCAEKVLSTIEQDYGWSFSHNDSSFLTLYISRVIGQ